MKTQTESDEQLLRSFAAGDKAALAELARRYEGLLLGFARGLVNARENRLAYDVVQETWLRVIRYAASFDGRSSFKTWLYRIAVNQCRSLLAARPASTAPESAAANSAPAPGPDQAAESSEFADRVRDAVRHLPPDPRLVVLLCYHGGMTHEQAAEILEIPVGTLKSRLHAALQELRERLIPEMKP